MFPSFPNVLGAQGVLTVAALARMSAGCSGATVNDNGPDATPSDSSAIDSSDVALRDVASPGADSSVDASEASPPVCTQILAEGCTPNPPFLWGNGNTVDFSNCPPTWNDAISSCLANAPDFGFAQADCGTYLRWHVENVDVGCSYYYDATGGDLVAVFCGTCLGGPLGFTEPACAPLQLQDYRPCVPSDELGDGGKRGDAASAD